jgi:hypothetical protein
MTSKTSGQVPVFSKEDIYKRCQEAGFIDCRINGYPEYTEYQGIVRHPPDFIFIDFDFSKFRSDKKRVDRVLDQTLTNISELGAKPTVLWSGNGYHIYLPIEAMVLDLIDIFSKDKFPGLFSDNYHSKYHGYSVSELFLKFAKDHLTNGNADKQHHPKYKTCLIRFPNTYNSKNLKNGLTPEQSKVKLIQKWNARRIPIHLLLKDFRRWITQEELDQKRMIKRLKSTGLNNTLKKSDRIEWIEKLLQTPLDDYRKTCLWRILCPYLINVRKLSVQEAVLVLQEWLSKSNNLRKSDFNHNQQIKKDLKHVGIHLPLSYQTLKEKEPELYYLLKSKGLFN